MDKMALTRVFVYGTLKTGQPNNFYLANSIEKGSVILVGKGQLLEKFPLVIAGRYNIPYVLYAKGLGNRVIGEVYDVDNETLKDLDDLEKIPHHYQREYLEAELLDGKESNSITTCLTYVCKPFKPELLERPYYSEYDAYGSHGLVYSNDCVDHYSVDVINDVVERPKST